jgi:hypothetical protein
MYLKRARKRETPEIVPFHMTCVTVELVLGDRSRFDCMLPNRLYAREIRRAGLGVKMKRIAASIIVGVFLLTTVAIEVAVAHTFVATTSLTIQKFPRGATNRGAAVVIAGKLKSARAACRTDKVVKLMKVRPGPDRLLATDRTDSEGEYLFIRHPRRDQTVYTRFSGTLDTSYGHSHECLKSRSRSRFINTV